VGIIQKQSVKGFIYTYIGVIIGFITTGILMPRFLQQNEIGLLRVLTSYSTLLAQFAGLGFSIVAIRMFPYFRDPETKNHGFFGLFLMVSIVGFILSMFGFLFYYQFYLKSDISELFQQYLYWIPILTLFILLYTLIDSYNRALYDAIQGTITKEVIQRIFILLAIGLFIYGITSINGLVFGYVLAFAIPPIFMFIPHIRKHTLSFKPDFNYLDKNLRNKILGVSVFGLVSSFSNILVLNIDVLMIERYLDLSYTGIYSIVFFFGTLVLIPSRPLTRISAIIVADSFKKRDLKNIDLIYKKSSITLTIIGLLLFLGLAINMENIIKLIGEDYRPGYYVILLIAFANVIQMSSGVLNQIIFNSDYYRYSTYFIIGFAILIVITNIIFIPKYGITGAAFATLISKFIYVYTRIIFVKIKLHLNPFLLKTIIPLVLSIVLYALQSLIPPFENYIMDILIRSGFVAFLYGFFIYIFNVSDDINNWINEFKQKILQ